jgi:hypothetical protein
LLLLPATNAKAFAQRSDSDEAIRFVSLAGFEDCLASFAMTDQSALVVSWLSPARGEAGTAIPSHPESAVKIPSSYPGLFKATISPFLMAGDAEQLTDRSNIPEYSNVKMYRRRLSSLRRFISAAFVICDLEDTSPRSSEVAAPFAAVSRSWVR